MSNRKKQLCLSVLRIAVRIIVMTVIGFGAVTLSQYVGGTVPTVSEVTTDPIRASNQTATSDPTVTSNQTATSDLTATSNSTEVTDPTEAADPTEASNSTDAADPTVTSDPTEASNSTEAADPTEAANSEPHNVTYVLGDELFLSRDELYMAFFGDFYDFILMCGGGSGLAKEGFSDKEAFLGAIEKCRSDPQCLRDHANSFGGYFMSMRANSTLADQPSSTFLGYCRDNGRWTEFIRELTMFFSCWRSDEGCAGLHNSGADFYADTWSTIVDIYKFFWHTSATCTAHSQRVYDYFDHPPCVVQGYLPDSLMPGESLPCELSLRGQVFAGWYLSPDGDDAVTKMPDSDVTLYARWQPDAEYRSRLDAALVEWQIYNLTTRTARVTPETVGQAKAAYDALTPDEQAMVGNTAVLDELIRLVLGEE